MIEASVSIGRAALLLGVSLPTLRRWEKVGKIAVKFRTLGGHRRYSMSELKRIIGVEDDRKVVGYARVSSHDQKSDLITQADRLKGLGCDEVIQDLGSGLNCKKRGLIKLLHMIISGGVSKLVLIHKDRLLRFGHELVFKLCEWFAVEVYVVESSENDSFEVELSKDVITLMTVFSAKLYGRRSHKNKRVKKIELDK